MVQGGLNDNFNDRALTINNQDTNNTTNPPNTTNKHKKHPLKHRTQNANKHAYTAGTNTLRSRPVFLADSGRTFLFVRLLLLGFCPPFLPTRTRRTRARSKTFQKYCNGKYLVELAAIIYELIPLNHGVSLLRFTEYTPGTRLRSNHRLRRNHHRSCANNNSQQNYKKTWKASTH